MVTLKAKLSLEHQDCEIFFPNCHVPFFETKQKVGKSKEEGIWQKSMTHLQFISKNCIQFPYPLYPFSNFWIQICFKILLILGHALFDYITTSL